jgi:hypothetical protein
VDGGDVSGSLTPFGSSAGRGAARLGVDPSSVPSTFLAKDSPSAVPPVAAATSPPETSSNNNMMRMREQLDAAEDSATSSARVQLPGIEDYTSAFERKIAAVLDEWRELEGN